MKHSEFNCVSNDGLSLHFQIWQPADKIKGVVCVVHGHGEHLGRYEHVSKKLNDNGYALIGFDLRGHGKSEGKRGHSPSISAFMDDIAMLLEKAHHEFVGIPLFIFGHSLGGTLVLNFMLRRKPNVLATIVTAPSLMPIFPIPKWKLSISRFLRIVLPTCPIPTGLTVSSLSRNHAVVEAYKKDALVHGLVTAKSGLDILEMGKWALQHANEISLPLLLMHGTKDQLTSMQATEAFAKEVKNNCTLKLWEGFYHELHNEPEQEEVLTFLVSWLDKQIEK